MLKYILLVVIIVALFLFILNLVELFTYVVRKITIKDSKIKKETRICFISDLHNFKVKDKFYEDIRNNKPDLILLGGDIITAKPGKNQDNAYSFLKEVSSIAPTYLALGNHEYRAKIYKDEYGDMYTDLEKYVLGLGIKILSNNSVSFDDMGIIISASEIDRYYYKRFIVRKMEDDYIESLLGKCDKDYYNILLAHNPDYFKNYSNYGSDLILSGHVHGGLIRLPFIGGIAHPGVRFFPKYSDGIYNEFGKRRGYKHSQYDSDLGIVRLIVSCGVGFHTLPLRLFNPGELIFVTFKEK